MWVVCHYRQWWCCFRRCGGWWWCYLNKNSRCSCQSNAPTQISRRSLM